MPPPGCIVFAIAVLAFLLVVYVVMRSPEAEALDRERLEYFRRENERARAVEGR